MTEGLPWDVVVIGAGPAGSSSARAIAEAGWRVLILERRRQVGMPVQCAEYIPMAVARAVDVPENAAAQPVEAMRTFIQGKLAAENRWPGMMLHRASFDQAMADRAVSLGAQLLTRCQVESVDGHVVTFRERGRLRHARARIIVGADGPLSVTGRCLGLRNQAFVHGLQVELRLATGMNHTEVHFRPEFRGGYGWVFPKGKSANVGVGVIRSAAGELPGLLDAFVDDLRVRGVIGMGAPSRKTGGLIPVSGPLPRSVDGHRLLVGDAAGQTDPITGGGIPAAIECGRMAGEAANAALGAETPALIGRYEERWRDFMGQALDRARRRRATLERDWNDRSFERLIRRSWIGFGEYYRDRTS
jgi:geranylgeranyl reductase family protein